MLLSFLAKHFEGRAIVSLFGLLFWDEIYNDQVPSLFYSKRQSYPLDLYFQDFFKNREDLLVEKLEKMRTSGEWTIEDAISLLEMNWRKYKSTESIVSWGSFYGSHGSCKRGVELARVNSFSFQNCWHLRF